MPAVIAINKKSILEKMIHFYNRESVVEFKVFDTIFKRNKDDIIISFTDGSKQKIDKNISIVNFFYVNEGKFNVKTNDWYMIVNIKSIYIYRGYINGTKVEYSIKKHNRFNKIIDTIKKCLA